MLLDIHIYLLLFNSYVETWVVENVNAKVEGKKLRLIDAISWELLGLPNEDKIALITSVKQYLEYLEKIVGRGSVGAKEETSES